MEMVIWSEQETGIWGHEAGPHFSVSAIEELVAKKKKKGVQKRRSIQQPIFIISGTVSHTHSQASERIHLGKAREGLDFKRKMFFAFQRFLMFTIPALLPTQIKDGRGNSLRDL